jgi:FKBP-type peptidyl-prolyl cis-trans isomerase
MKYKLMLILTVLLAALIFGSCKGKFGSSKKEENINKDASYALGMYFGSNIAHDGMYPNLKEVLKGMEDEVYGKKTRYTQDEAMTIIQEAFSAMTEKRAADAMQKGIDFLAANSKKRDVKTTDSGLQYEVITSTDGPKPSASDVVRVHYEGKLIDGDVFDSSYERGTPIELPLNGVIAGWTEGLQLMGVGSKYKLYIPSELGYGQSAAGSIPPNSVLIFDVELLDIIEQVE